MRIQIEQLYINKKIFAAFLTGFVFTSVAVGQHKPPADTFFLAKKKGLLGRFGKLISANTPEIQPVKIENQFVQFKGKIIRNIDLISLGFESSINDTTLNQNSFGLNIAKRLHHNSRGNTIRKNLFFREGDKLYPYLLADNERYLRELIYLQDAKILVDYVEDETDSVDVIVLTKDVFSLGAKLVIDSRDRGRVDLKEENFYGTGSKLMVSSFYDGQRQPRSGYGAEFIKRNIRGSFVDWTSGFQTYNRTFNNGLREEATFYSRLERPLVTPYMPLTGAIGANYFRTHNAYPPDSLMDNPKSDSLYNADTRYTYYQFDAWAGYNIDSKSALYANKSIRRHRFVAARIFNQKFLDVPSRLNTTVDTLHQYIDITAFLASINIFKQVFYKTNFIYGFGVSEDIPEGYSVALTGGFANKQGLKRPYGGIDVQLTKFNRRGVYNNYTFRIGGYFHDHRFEDADLLFELEHITHLKKVSHDWRMRSFITTSLTAQVNPVLNAPLFLNSVYGLPYFNDYRTYGDMRATVHGESVFFNTRKLLGFRFAPFIFSDASLIKPTKMNLKNSDIYTAIGGGVRSRNENLIFGTIELKGYYFPRHDETMNDYKIELNSNLRFKYKSVFIRKPDFIIDN